MDPKNHGLEKGFPFNYGGFLISMSVFRVMIEFSK